MTPQTFAVILWTLIIKFSILFFSYNVSIIPPIFSIKLILNWYSQLKLFQLYLTSIFKLTKLCNTGFLITCLHSQCTPTCDLGPAASLLAGQHNTGLDHEVGLMFAVPHKLLVQNKCQGFVWSCLDMVGNLFKRSFQPHI